MATLASLVVSLALDNDQFAAGLAQSESRVQSFAGALGGHIQTAGRMAMAGINAIAGAAAAGAAVAVNQAADAVEMMSKFEVVFGDFAAGAARDLETFAAQVGRSKFELMGMASQIQDTFVPLGFARGEAADMSVQLAQLAVDVGSFNNVADADVMDAFTSALVGNHMAVRQFGIIISEATLDAELMRMGIEGGTRAATEQEKVLARMNIILASTEDAHGDAARTADSWANSMRGLKATISDAVTELGLRLIPALSPFLSLVGRLAENAIPRLNDVLEPGIRLLTRAGQAVEVFANVIERGGGPINALVGAYHRLTGGNIEATRRFRETVEGIAGFIDQVLAAISPITQFIGENVKLQDVLVAVGAAILSVVVPALISAITAVAPVVAVFLGLIAVAALVRAALVNDFLGIRTLFENVANAVDTFKRAIEAGASPIQALSGALFALGVPAENIGGILNTVRTVLTHVSAVFQSVADVVMTSVWPVLQEAFASIGESFAALGLEAVPLGDILRVVATVLGAVLVGAIGLVVGVISGLAGGLATLGESFTRIFGNIRSLVEGWATFFSNAVQAVKALLAGDFPGALEYAKAALGGLAQAFTSTWLLIGNIVRGAVEFVIGLVGGLINGIVGFFTNLHQRLVGGSIIPEMLAAILAAFTTKLAEVLTVISTWINDALTFLRGTISQFAQVGRDMMDGLRRGILEAAARMIAALSDVVARAMGVVRRLLGIGSPSRWAIEVAENVMSSMGQGLRDSADLAVNAMRAATGEMMAASTVTVPAMATVGAGGGQQAMVFNATFVLDGREIGRAAWSGTKDAAAADGIVLEARLG